MNKKEKTIRKIAKLLLKETIEDFCSCEIIAEQIYDLILEEGGIVNENDKWTRYRCDNPKCTSGVPGGGFFIKKGPCPYCGSKDYHSFNAHPKHLKRVIDDLIKH